MVILRGWRITFTLDALSQSWLAFALDARSWSAFSTVLLSVIGALLQEKQVKFAKAGSRTTTPSE
jgi:hypothetical protein